MLILQIIDARWASQLSRHLHAAAYYLNPAIHYNPRFNDHSDVKLGLYACLDKMVPNKSELLKESHALPQDKQWLINLDKIARKSTNLAIEDLTFDFEVESMARDISEACGQGHKWSIGSDEQYEPYGDQHEPDKNDNDQPVPAHDDANDDNYQPTDEQDGSAPGRYERGSEKPSFSCVGTSSRPSEVIPDVGVNLDDLWWCGWLLLVALWSFQLICCKLNLLYVFVFQAREWNYQLVS